jgi:hypothetical protein
MNPVLSSELAAAHHAELLRAAETRRRAAAAAPPRRALAARLADRAAELVARLRRPVAPTTPSTTAASCA